jgi:subtilase family serine protease
MGLTPAEMRQAYGFSGFTVSVAGRTVVGDGSGQTIAVVTAFLTQHLSQDLRTFDEMFGLPNRAAGGKALLTIANPQGASTVNAGWNQETALDVEWAHAIAPGARILLVEAKSQSENALLEAAHYAAKARGVSVVSMSWGFDTAPAANLYTGVFTTPENHLAGFKRGDGVTFVEAAGDDGVATAWPTTMVNVVSVGGTDLTIDADGTYEGETLLPQSTAPARVAYDAGTGVAFYDSVAFMGSVGWQEARGTSVGAPQWAGLIAIADQGRADIGKHSLDTATQTLPALASLPNADFHAIPGSEVSGRGSPVASALIKDLVEL